MRSLFPDVYVSSVPWKGIAYIQDTIEVRFSRVSEKGCSLI